MREIRNAFYQPLQYLFCSRLGLRVLLDLSTGGEIPVGAGSGFSTTAEGRRLLRFHNSVDAWEWALVAQMPAITNVLARIGLITPPLDVASVAEAVVIILIVAAVHVATNDVPNMLLFAGAHVSCCT